MQEGLKIVAGGKLLKTKWVFDKALDEGSYVTSDITDSAIQHLFDYCELATDVTLRDIFLLLNAELELFDLVLGNWCKEIVTEGLLPDQEAYIPNKYDPEGIEYLELYKSLHTDATDKETYGTVRPDLGGVGYVLQEDKLHYWSTSEKPDIEYHKGTRINWSLSFLSASKIINLPVKLKTDLVVYNEDAKAAPGTYRTELAKYPGIGYTLGDILNGIIWELSFHGDPKARKKSEAELQNTINEIDKAEKEGRLDEVLVPHEQIKSLFNEKEDK